MECHTMGITNGTHDITSLDMTHIDLDLAQHSQNERSRNIGNQLAEVHTMKHNGYVRLTKRHLMGQKTP